MIYCLRHRGSAKFDRIAPAGFRILAALDHATQACETDLLITCGSDSHRSSDPHTTGEAYDVSVAALQPTKIVVLKRFLDDVLGPLFTCLYEVPAAPSDPMLRDIAYVNPEATGPHFHIQRKKGTVYPPLLGARRV